MWGGRAVELGLAGGGGGRSLFLETVNVELFLISIARAADTVGHGP